MLQEISRRKSLRCVAVALFAFSLAALAGCGGDSGGSTSSHCSETDDGNGNHQVNCQQNVDPPGSVVAAIDTSQALLNLAVTNATISSTSGTVTLTLTDETTNQVVGQQSFGYVVQGTSLYAQDPAAVHNWLQQFAGYAAIDVGVDVTSTLKSTGAGGATVSAVYQGTTYASSSVSWAGSPVGGGGCHTRICPNQ